MRSTETKGTPGALAVASPQCAGGALPLNSASRATTTTHVDGVVGVTDESRSLKVRAFPERAKAGFTPAEAWGFGGLSTELVVRLRPPI